MVKVVNYFWPLILCSRDLTFFQFPLLFDIFQDVWDCSGDNHERSKPGERKNYIWTLQFRLQKNYCIKTVCRASPPLGWYLPCIDWSQRGKNILFLSSTQCSIHQVWGISQNGNPYKEKAWLAEEEPEADLGRHPRRVDRPLPHRGRRLHPLQQVPRVRCWRRVPVQQIQPRALSQQLNAWLRWEISLESIIMILLKAVSMFLF